MSETDKPKAVLNVNRIVTLIEPIDGHKGQIKEVVLRPPKFADIMALGEPSAFARSETGMMFTAEKDSVIEGYISRLLVQPEDPALLMQCGAADTLQLRDAVHDFFADARKAATAT